jgi:hypothetical protein
MSNTNRAAFRYQSEQALWETLRRAQSAFLEIIASGSREEFTAGCERYIQALRDYHAYLFSRNTNSIHAPRAAGEQRVGHS